MTDTNNVKSSSRDKKVFNNLDKLINYIKSKKKKKKKNKKKNKIKKIKKFFYDLY